MTHFTSFFAFLPAPVTMTSTPSLSGDVTPTNSPPRGHCYGFSSLPSAKICTRPPRKYQPRERLPQMHQGNSGSFLCHFAFSAQLLLAMAIFQSLNIRKLTSFTLEAYLILCFHSVYFLTYRFFFHAPLFCPPSNFFRVSIATWLQEP